MRNYIYDYRYLRHYDSEKKSVFLFRDINGVKRISTWKKKSAKVSKNLQDTNLKIISLDIKIFL